MIRPADRLARSLSRPPIDLRYLLQPSTYDQGPRPLCIPFSASLVHEAARSYVGNIAPDPLAPEPLWDHCIRSSLSTFQGTTLQAVAGALVSEGQPPLDCWPYNPMIGPSSEPPPASALSADWYVAEIITLPLAHDGIETLIEEVLAAWLPVVLVIELTNEFENPTTTGEISVPPITAPVGDYHAIVAVGAATDSSRSSRRLLVRNSWGSRWGAGGFGWLPFEYLIAFAVQAAVIDTRSCHTTTLPSQ